MPLLERYTSDDLAIFSPEDRRELGIDDRSDPRQDPVVAWELLYRIEPDLYDRLVSAERLHPEILGWLPAHVERIVEVAAGSGRLTVDLLGRCDELTAIEPAAPLREILIRKLDALAGSQAPILPSPASGGANLWPEFRVISGFFDALPIPDRSAELVIALSALTPEPAHGGERGLTEMERVCAGGGMVVIIWPNHVEWLMRHGYQYVSFEGDMAMEFASPDEAIELAQIFYPHAVEAIRRRGDRRVPYDLLGVNPPRDLAYKTTT